MIALLFTVLFIAIAVAALVVAMHVKPLVLQIALASWAVLATMAATRASETRDNQPPSEKKK